MKKVVSISIALVAALTAFGQGQIDTRNVVSGVVGAPIYGLQPGAEAVRISGNPATADGGNPAGTAVYAAGTKLAGTGFIAEIWAGPDADHLTPVVLPGTTTVARMNFKTGSTAGRLDTIIGSGGKTVAEVTGVAANAKAMVQVRVWAVTAGVDSWAQALAKGNVATGQSEIFQSEVLAGSKPGDPTQSFMKNLRSFNLTVPEPSIISLGVLGLGAMLIRRRK